MRLPLFAAAALAIGLITHTNAFAAPQILAALEIEEGMPFHCDGKRCETDISTFCLQQDRDTPRSGTAYAPASNEHFRLRLTKADGSVQEIPATDLTYTSARGFTSVRVSLPASRMTAMGATSARLVVVKQASLIPVEQPGDPDPITPKEKEYVTKSLRAVGEELVETQHLAKAARIIGRVATAITDYRALPSKENVERLWNDVIDDMGPALEETGTNGRALESAVKELNGCTRKGHHHSLAGVKSCLEYRHGDMMRDLNIDYWNRQPGS